jgi:hypothetical protein
MICRNCGHAIEGQDGFCSYCGQSTGDTTALHVTAEQETPHDQKLDPATATPQESKQKRNTEINKRTITLAILVAVVLVAGGVIAGIALSMPKNNEGENSPQAIVERDTPPAELTQGEEPQITAEQDTPSTKSTQSENRSIGFSELSASYEKMLEIDAGIAEAVRLFNRDFNADLATRKADYELFKSQALEPFLNNDWLFDKQNITIESDLQDDYSTLSQCFELLGDRIALMDDTFLRSLEFPAVEGHEDYIKELLAEVYVIVGDGTGGNNSYNAEFQELITSLRF